VFPVKPVLLLTGQPGTGKTSLVKQAVAESAISAGGFYTEEIRKQGIRVGFKLVTLDGREAVLSHIDFSKRYRVGKYGVDIDILNEVGVASIRKASRDHDLVVIDEIGRMEMLSADFRDAVREIIGSGKRVLGTIMRNADPYADDIKRQPQVNLVVLSRDNYGQVLDDVREWLTYRVVSDGEGER
jgi:nucleoside-triphosphatase